MHEVGFDGIAIVVADEMQDTVGDEKLELQGERHAEPAGLSPRGIDRNHDLADQSARRFGDLQREGQDVRPPPHAAKGVVESSNLGIRDQRDVDGAPRASGSPERPARGLAKRTNGSGNTPLAVLDRQPH